MKKIVAFMILLLLSLKVGHAEETDWITIDNQQKYGSPMEYNSQTVQRALGSKKSTYYWLEVKQFNKLTKLVEHEIWMIDIQQNRYFPLWLHPNTTKYPRVRSGPISQIPELLTRVGKEKFSGKPFTLEEDLTVNFPKHNLRYFLNYNIAFYFSDETEYFSQTFTDSSGDTWCWVNGAFALKDEYLDRSELDRWHINPTWLFHALVNINKKQGWIFRPDSLQYVKIEKDEFDQYFGELLENIKK